MNVKLNKKLISKYPELFGADEVTPYSQRGIECGDGWYSLLDNTLSLIDNHAKNPQWVEEPLFKLKVWYNKIFWNKILYPIGSLFTRGIPKICSATEAHKYEDKWNRYYTWQHIFMANPIYVKPKTSPVIRIVQIKEKFGGLRIHIKGSDEFINGVTSLAQSLAYKICENCGTNQDVITNKKGWHKTYCAKCRKKVTKY